MLPSFYQTQAAPSMAAAGQSGVHMTTATRPVNGTICKVAPSVQFEGVTVVTCPFKQPARRYYVEITESLVTAPDAPEAYKALVEASLRKAAKDICSDYLRAFSQDAIPTQVPEHLFTREEIIDRATAAGFEWLTKEELTAAWTDSATRKQWIVDKAELYKTSKEFRIQVQGFADDICKLAARNVSIDPDRAQTMLAKLNNADLTSDFGEFVTRRLAAFAAKPKPTLSAADLL